MGFIVCLFVLDFPCLDFFSCYSSIILKHNLQHKYFLILLAQFSFSCFFFFAPCVPLQTKYTKDKTIVNSNGINLFSDYIKKSSIYIHSKTHKHIHTHLPHHRDSGGGLYTKRRQQQKIMWYSKDQNSTRTMKRMYKNEEKKMREWMENRENMCITSCTYIHFSEQ